MRPGPMTMVTSLKLQGTSCDKMSRGTMPRIIKCQASSNKHHNPWRKAQAAGPKQQASVFVLLCKVLEGYKRHPKLG